MYNISVSSHTDIGDVKLTNQDCILTKTGIINNHNVGLFIVADDCGGLSFGEEISNLIVIHFSRIWDNELKSLLQSPVIRNEDIDSLLEKAIKDINEGALAFSHQVESKVGSTLSLLLTIDDKFYIKNVGDSRVYLLRGKHIEQLTEDQSLVADMIRNGELTKEEAKDFKKKNVLTMCIGVFDEMRTYSKSGKIKNNDIFLLCCDGIHNRIPPEKMFEIINNKKTPFENKAEEMRIAIEQGVATDNVSSVICIFYKKRSLWKKLILLITILSIIFAGILLMRNRIIKYIENSITCSGIGYGLDEDNNSANR